jgi:hypothetical protein
LIDSWARSFSANDGAICVALMTPLLGLRILACRNFHGMDPVDACDKWVFTARRFS